MAIDTPRVQRNIFSANSLPGGQPSRQENGQHWQCCAIDRFKVHIRCATRQTRLSSLGGRIPHPAPLSSEGEVFHCVQHGSPDGSAYTGAAVEPCSSVSQANADSTLR